MLLSLDGPGDGLIKQIYDLTREFPLVKKDFVVSNNGYLRTTKSIVRTTDIDALLKWITADMVTKLPSKCRNGLRVHLFRQMLSLCKSLKQQDLEQVKMLPIFRQVSAVMTEHGTKLR